MGGDTGMLKSLVEKINNGDTNNVSEREIFLGIFYELQAVNTKLDTLNSSVVKQEERIEDLEDFKIEYQSYGKSMPIVAVIISFIIGVIALWDRIKH